MAQRPIGGFHEHDANSVIADWLSEARPGWLASGERTGTIKDSNDRPDVVIRQGNRMPVIVECEFGNPATVDAGKRLGKTLVGESRPFTEVIAIGIDERRRADDPASFRQRLDRNEPIFHVQLVSGSNSDDCKVWPVSPLSCTPSDLVAYCEYAQVPQAVINAESENIAIDVAAAGHMTLESISLTQLLAKPTLEKLRAIVGGKTDGDTTRTACAIWLIAIDLQNDLAAYSPTLQQLNLKSTTTMMEEERGLLLKDDLVAQWRIIQGVNYLPVMELAVNSLVAVTLSHTIAVVLRALERLSVRLNTLQAKHIYNFAGELWQRLVSDREERAAHYTKPETAELLATLAAERFSDRTAAEFADLSLMDAACGTGTLIGAGERAIRRKYFAKGGRDVELHRRRMEERIYAMDVNGIAGTLTAKRLTDMDVEQEYSDSKIAVITDPAGSLILLDPGTTGVSNVLGYRNVTPTTGAGGDEGVFHVMLQGIDWSLMNPPYSRPRRGREQATRGLAPLRAAAKRRKYLMSHGQAGLASDFGNLSNIRLAPGGVYSHVLPLTAAHSGSWQAWRAELEKDFENIVVIANVSSAELQSMSADTGMNEMLVIATKRAKRPKEWQPTEILCVNLHSAPATLSEGYALAKEVAAIPTDGATGLLSCGNYTRFQHDGPGFPWSAVGNYSTELTAVTTALLNGTAYDHPTLVTHELALPTAALGDIANTGPTHHTIGHPRGNDPIGAFEWSEIDSNSRLFAHRSLWSTIPGRQKTIYTEPTHAGMISNHDLAQRIVHQRSLWFLNRNIRWTSQSTAVSKTLNQTHGGRSWNALQDLSDDVGQCIALYCNSIIGAIVRNAYGQSTHPGRAPIQIGAVAGLPCPAFHADTPEAQRARGIAGEHFDELARLELQPFAYCFRDSNRHRIDSVVAKMLGLDPEDGAIQDMLARYRLLFAGEPNVNGRQKSIVDALDKYRR